LLPDVAIGAKSTGAIWPEVTSETISGIVVSILLVALAVGRIEESIKKRGITVINNNDLIMLTFA
jgi:hypothetical protein